MTTSAPTAADLDAAQTALSVARAEHAVTSEKVTIAYNLMKNLRATETKSILTGRSHEDFWTDPDLRAFVIERDWNGGTGDAYAGAFLSAAIEELAPGSFYEYTRFTSSDASKVTRVAPRLSMKCEQDTTAAEAAVLLMLPILRASDSTGEVESFLYVDVLEHNCSEFGSIAMKVYGPDRAMITRSGREEFTGTLNEMLTRVARDFWFTGGNDDDYDK